MRYILSKDEMRAADNWTSEKMHVSSAVLMERAAILTAGRVIKRLEKGGKKVLIFCGPGNNGGDGFATGRILLEQGVEVTILYIGDEGKMSPLLREQYLSVKALKDEAVIMGADFKDEADVIVDALFGISLSRPVEGDFASCIREINRRKDQGAYVISIDIPSGIDADTGLTMGEAVRADETLVCGFVKRGNILYPGAFHSGELIIGNIGITEKSLVKLPKVMYLEDKDLSLPDRRADINKGSCGKVLLLSGSRHIAGAAVLSAKAALRCGCGMVKVLTNECNRVVLQSVIPEVLVSTYPDSPGGDDGMRQMSLFDNDNDRELEELIKNAVSWCTVIAAGPGIGTDERSVRILKLLLKNTQNKPVVLDADALNIIAGNTEMLTECGSEIVITPHLMEMSRLTGIPVSEIKSHMMEVAGDFASGYHVTTVLKDARTVTALQDGTKVINLNGNNGMATAGSGDVLTGIIASLIAQGTGVEKAAYLGAAIHGAAGDRAMRIKGVHGLMAGDIIENIGDHPESAGF